ncbi:MAG: hypothetical protein R2746_16470 [Acidimicrobiales bacterium]
MLVRTWALDRFHRHGRRPVEELARVMFSAHRLHLVVFALNALAVGVPFALIARQRSMGRSGPSAWPPLSAARWRWRRCCRPWASRRSRSRRRCPSSPPSTTSARSPPTSAHPSREATARGPHHCSRAGAHHRARAGHVHLPRHRPAGAPRARPRARAGPLRGHRGRERRRQDHLLKLLCGFYRPTSGGSRRRHRPRRARPRAWRRRLAVIFQDSPASS